MELHQIPAELGLLEGLKEVKLDRNNLRRNLPGEIFYPLDLQVLSASFNQLEGSIPNEVKHASNLHHLRLNHNNLKGSLPNEMNRLTNLRELDLAYNLIEGRLPPLDRLTNMVLLSFDSNPFITGQIPTSFASFSDLRFLSVANTTMTPVSPEYQTTQYRL